MQFFVDGYTLSGDPVALTDASGSTPVRVGDGTNAGAGMVARIASVLTGTGGLVKTDLGTLILTGASTYRGDTTVRGGTLTLAGSVAGAVSVSGGATLSGSGTVGQTVHVQDGGTLAGAPGIGLTMGGLDLSDKSTLAVTLGGPSQAGMFQVNGDVTLGGTLAVMPTVGFGAGVYRIVTYTGGLTDHGLQVGGLTAGLLGGVQTALAHQVNLIVENSNNPLSFWSGTGTWSAGTSRTDGFAVFQGTPGTVTVDSSAVPVTATGMQFAASGYQVVGGTITLAGSGSGSPMIRVGDGTAAGAGTVAVIASALAGNAGLAKGDYGTLVLSGANTYTGGTTVSGGTLQVGADTALGAPSGGVTLDGGTLAASASLTSGRLVSLGANGGSLAVAKSSTLTLTGALTGAGGLTKTGTGTLLVLGTGSATGGTTISQGTLQIGNGGTAGAIAGAIVNNARLIYDRSDTYEFRGAVSGTGQVDFRGGGKVLYGNAGAFTGPVSVSDTMVRLDPGSVSASPFTLQSAGVLGGTATVGALTVNAGGVASPGYSPGTLSVNGPVTFNAGSIYAVDVTPDGQHDLIIATGAVTLSPQAQVKVSAVPGRYAPNARYAILTTSATVSGQFGGVTSDYALLKPTLSYDTDNVYLGLVSNDRRFSDFAHTRNALSVARAAQALGLGNRVYDRLTDLAENQVGRAFERLDGEGHASLNTVIQQQSVYLREAVGARLRQSETGADALATAARAAGPATRNAEGDPGRTVWAQAYGGLGRRFGDGNAGAIANTIGGMLAGLDVTLGEAIRVGVVGGLSRSTFDVPSREMMGSFNNSDVGVYAGASFGAFSLRGGLAQSWHEVTAKRVVAFPGYSASNGSRYTVRDAQAFGEASYDVALGAGRMQPFASLAYVGVDGHRVTERDAGGSALTGTVRVQGVLYTTLGTRAATTVQIGGVVLTPSVTLGWQHAFGDVVPQASLAFAGGASPFAVYGVPVLKDAALLGAGLAYDLSEVSRIQVNYTGQIGPRATQNAFTAEYVLKF